MTWIVASVAALGVFLLVVPASGESLAVALEPYLAPRSDPEPERRWQPTIDAGGSMSAIGGAFVGLGFGLAARRPHFIFGVICAILALGWGLFCEWSWNKFVADDSFFYFLTHLHQIDKPILTWIFVLIGCAMAFSFGRGRN